MCGIAAICRAEGHSSIPNVARLARALAVALESRGRDATGFGWAAEDGWPWFWKNPGPAARVAPLAPLITGMRQVLIHTRYATLGDPAQNVNNHPVHAPGLVAVHNGVLRNHEELFRSLNYQPQGQVDSEAIPALLAAGPEILGDSDPASLLSLIDGAAAMAWLDSRDPGVLHLARLRGRPLVIGWTRRGDLIAASTETALKRGCGAEGLTLARVRHIPEGTYLRVEGGRIVREARVDMPPPPPTALVQPVNPVRKPKGRYAHTAYRTPREAPQPIDGIDWDALVPRRGWTAPGPSGKKSRWSVRDQAWIDTEETES